MKKTFSISIEISNFKNKLLKWASSFKLIAHYDNNSFNENKYARFECLTAVSDGLSFDRNFGEHAWDEFEKFKSQNHKNWLFGYFGYDLKNELENLDSNNPDFQKAPSLSFFAPEIVVALPINSNSVEIIAENPDLVWNEIIDSTNQAEYCPKKVSLKHRISKEAYIEAVEKIRAHIIDGDMYEMNFCQEFYAEGMLEAAGFYSRINRLSPAPFSAWFKISEHHIFCASPERFLYKDTDKLVSQPIKGTVKRSSDILEDLRLKEELRNSEKDQAENVMIVDLVRNDLARTAIRCTVKVEELFGIYGFRQVWQMISTVSSRFDQSQDSLAAIKAAFPPGSMTGAPKIISMELIEKFESSLRGTFSGTLGYFSPDGNFDFNVLIRSIFYNEKESLISFQTGGAIVYDSNPEQEYEECMLKAKAMLLALGID